MKQEYTKDRPPSRLRLYLQRKRTSPFIVQMLYNVIWGWMILLAFTALLILLFYLFQRDVFAGLQGISLPVLFLIWVFSSLAIVCVVALIVLPKYGVCYIFDIILHNAYRKKILFTVLRADLRIDFYYRCMLMPLDQIYGRELNCTYTILLYDEVLNERALKVDNPEGTNNFKSHIKAHEVFSPKEATWRDLHKKNRLLMVMTAPKRVLFKQLLELEPSMEFSVVYWRRSKILKELCPIEGRDYNPEVLDILNQINAMYP